MTQHAENSFLDAADRIGARLCRDALWADGRCNWLGASMEPVGGTWTTVQRTFGPDLYSGTSGIALFLARLYSLNGEPIYAQTALGALQQALSRMADIPPMARISLYSGHMGIAYASMILGDLFENETVHLQGQKMAQSALSHAEEPAPGTDVLSGIAGAIPVLLWMHRRSGDELLIEEASRLGHELIHVARRGPHGWSWNTLNLPEAQRKQDLTGFSHGTAGIGWALLELYHATQQAEFRQAAEQAFCYERHWFNPAQNNWPDFRGLNEGTAQPGAEPSYMAAWCHGAPGIGLSRVRAHALLGDAMLRKEAEIAIESTTQMLTQAQTSQQENYSLCHGQGGNADLLIYGGQAFNRPELLEKAAEIGRVGIERHHGNQSPWPCGVMGAGETPGLLLGTAGIGYFYLRLAAPKKIPSVLIPLPAQS